MKQSDEIRARIEEARTNRERLFGELENLRAREQADGASDGISERIANVNRAVANADQHVAELEASLGRLAYVERVAAEVPGALIPGSPEPPQTTTRREHGSESREAALRTVERYQDSMDSGAADTVDSLIRHDDPQEQTSRYVRAVGDPAYASAFGKMMADPTHGHLRYSAEEVEAVRNVSQIQAERAMSIGTDPNPARDPRVKLPKRVREEVSPPPADHVLAILEHVHDPRRRLLFMVIEQGALRLGEAVRLRWGDVDRAGLRLRLRASATKRDKARWVYLPEWLMDAIEDTCPLEDRTPDRPVFQGVTEATAYQTMTRACSSAGIPHYSPHSLRHRRITVWHQSGVSARELAERAGHSRPSMSLDVYSHVMPADEIASDRFMALIAERR